MARLEISPYSDRILVRSHEDNGLKHSPLAVPDSARRRLRTVLVAAVGPGRLSVDGKRIPIALEEGDAIVIRQDVGTEVILDGAEHLLLQETDVLAVIK